MDKKASIDHSKLVFRRAVPEDHEDVKAMCRGALGGRDILPAMYRHYVNDPDRRFYVAVYEGKVVAMTGGRVIDDGMTWEGQSGRALPGTTGAYYLTRRYLTEQFIIPKCPQTKLIRGTTRSEKAARESAMVSQVPGTTRAIVDLVWKAPITVIEQAMNIYKTKIQPKLDQIGLSIRQADRSDTCLVFTDKKFQKQFIPGGVLVCDSKPFDLLYKSNLRFVYADKEPNVFISPGGDNNNHHPMKAISFGTGIEMDVPMETLRYIIDYYGVQDLDTLIIHTIKHISTIPGLFAKSRTAKNVYVAVFLLEDQFNQNFLQQFIEWMSDNLHLGDGNAQLPCARQFVIDVIASREILKSKF